jgi:glutaminase
MNPSIEAGPSHWVSTGQLPTPEVVQSLVDEAHAHFASVDQGELATYIPALAAASPASFGISVAATGGATFRAGDWAVPFSIQSLSKPFLFALVCEAIGEQLARDALGVNSTGLPFNSVLAVERTEEGLSNPLVNAGAIATTSLVPGGDAAAQWRFIEDGLSRFAGRRLTLDQEVYRSEQATNAGNEAIASQLSSRQQLWCDPTTAIDLYTRQCALLVTAEDLALMACTLANGGRQPRSGEQVIAPLICRRVLAVMVTAGLYETSGDWLYQIGLPGKSGVSGGVITCAPGKGALATWSPPLDEAGNSVRGQLTVQFLSERLGLNLFDSRPSQDVTTEPP